METAIRVKSGWGDEGRTGRLLHPGFDGGNGLLWAVVVWDDEKEPELFKAHALETLDGKDIN